MKKRMEKVLFINLCICILLFPIANVFSYDYVNEKNRTSVELKRREIYSLRDMYQYMIGEDGKKVISNYGGVCSMVTVKGAGTYTLDEYVAGVVKHEIGSESDNPELLKAQAVAARSYVIASRGNSLDCTVDNGENFQTFSEVSPTNASDAPFIEAAKATTGQVVMRKGKVALTEYLSYPNAIFYTEVNGKWKINFQKFRDDSSTAWTWEGPSKAEVLAANNWASKSGAPSTKHHYGMSQTVAGWMAKNGKTYQEIIEIFYGSEDSSLETLPDGDYVGNIEYVDSDFGQISYFNQTDYKNYYYSTDASTPQYRSSKGWATIASHGCGPTSLAIVLSSFEGKQIGPVVITQQVCQVGGCSSGGSYYSSLKTVAEKYGYTGEFVAKGGNYSKVTNALASKNALVIVLMGPGTFTTGGHYIVLTGTRSDGYVSVADPASRKRTETKWFPFNLIVEQMKPSGFLIITK